MAELDNDKIATDDNAHNTDPEKKNIFTKNSKYFTIVMYGLLFVFFSILIFQLCGNFSHTMSVFGYIIKLFSPFIGGALIAFVLYPLVIFFYNKVFLGKLNMKSRKLSKILALLCSYIIAIGLLIVVLFIVVPQIYRSISELIVQIPNWYQGILQFARTFEQEHSDWTFLNFSQINDALEQFLPKIIDYLSGLLSNLVPMLFTTSLAIVSFVINMLIAIMSSIYMISDHKSIFFNAKRLLYAMLPKKHAETVSKVTKESGRIFTSFILGKAIDSLIIGIICLIAMSILRLPYAVLISVIVGITNMIPYFGPYIGGAIGGVIIVIVSPLQALVFLVLILVIQQFDGLYLGPKILGNSIGIKPLWIIVAITVGGALFGVIGMFLGVPIVAVLAHILDLIVSHLLNKREVTIRPYDDDERL